MLADTSKLVSNSAYRKTITDEERHWRVVYVDGFRQALQHIRGTGTGFISLNEISDDFYEVELAKPKVIVFGLSRLCILSQTFINYFACHMYFSVTFSR